MRRVLTVVALCAALFLAPVAGAYALWTAAASGTVTISVAVPAPALSCGVVSGNKVTLTWTSIGTGGTYTVYRRTGASAPYTYEAAGAAGSATSLQIKKSDFTGNPSTLVVVVRARANGADSADSNARSISFDANTGS